MVLTNQHVIDAIENVPALARFVMIFAEPTSQNGNTMFGVILRKIKATNSISSFDYSGPRVSVMLSRILVLFRSIFEGFPLSKSAAIQMCCRLD